MKTIKRNCWVLFLLCLLSCSDHTAFSEFHSFPDARWERGEPARFDVLINDTLSLYDLNLIVRNNNDYAFQNLWIFIDRKNPEGIHTRDSLNVELADVYGKWKGKGLSLYTLTIPYQSGISYPSSGTYSYTFRQGMRETPIRGISDIGLELSKRTVK